VVRHLVDARLLELDFLGERLLQVLALPVHVVADEAARDAAADRADQRAARAVGAVRRRAEDGAARGAEQNSRLGIRAVYRPHALAAVGSTAGRDADHQCNRHSSQIASFHSGYSVRKSWAP